MSASDLSNEPRPVPEVEVEAFVAWLYGGAEIRVSGPAYQTLRLPAPAALAQLIVLAEESGAQWLLADGPRPMRPTWLLDLCWEDRPEMPPRLQQATTAGCVRLAPLREALERRSAS